MQMTAEINPAATAWNAAILAARTAPPEQEDAAIAAMLRIEDAIDAAPVTSLADAVLKLELAMAMASRQGLDNDPAWLAVGDALAFLADAT